MKIGRVFSYIFLRLIGVSSITMHQRESFRRVNQFMILFSGEKYSEILRGSKTIFRIK
jgi:hypothetical protein